MHQDTICDLYVRLSLARDGKTAIERQEADCRAWAERNGLTVRKVHMDRGRSGYKTVERPSNASRSNGRSRRERPHDLPPGVLGGRRGGAYALSSRFARG
ncbi:recombinase family protein [Streptomyces sp. NPDC056431]|uniref:recombinase family protein n=1 Tax=Streptomyces sp. NPDC056431 TaxID=3345814 RepID=UPI0036A366B1